MVESTALEMRHTRKCIVGSNPTLSAKTMALLSSARKPRNLMPNLWITQKPDAGDDFDPKTLETSVLKGQLSYDHLQWLVATSQAAWQQCLKD